MLEKTILVILPIIGFALFTSAYMYSSIILLKNYPFPLDVVYIALTESRFNLFHIIQVDNEDNSVHSLKRIEDRYSSKLVCFSPYEACSTGLSDDNKKNGSTYLITKNTDSMPIMLGGSHNNGLRNHLNKDFSMKRKPSVKAASVLKNSYYSLKREMHLSRSSKNRIDPTSKKKEENTRIRWERGKNPTSTNHKKRKEMEYFGHEEIELNGLSLDDFVVNRADSGIRRGRIGVINGSVREKGREGSYTQ